ncbi:DNA-binding CsgD family transcriptional regulator [Actinoplanes tereljensis]|nr:helix-turn-helix transcriptional regulator [Actinoplanes tereljensis]
MVVLESFSELDGGPLALLGACLPTPQEPFTVLGPAGPGVTVVTGPAAFEPAILRRAAERRVVAADDDPVTTLTRLSRHSPLALVIDAANLLECRTFVENLFRRAGAESPIVVFAWHPASRTLSLSEPYRRLGLPPLPAAAVSELLPGDPYPTIGGNAAIVEAARDGTGFDRAVHQVLGEHGSAELPRFAQAVAVLGEHGDPFVLSRVLGMSLSRVGDLLDELLAAGLLTPGHLLRSRIEAAVLAGTAHLGRLHMRAAEVLYEDAAPAPAVAAHLLAAGAAPEAWATGALREAAEQAVRERRFDEAAARLSLALNWSAAAPARAEIRSALLDVRWWSDPALAADLLTALSAGARDGHLPPHRIARLARLATWQARADDARALLARSGGDPEADVQRAVSALWFQHVFPGSPPLPDVALRPELVAAACPWLSRATALGSTASDAVEVLRRIVPREQDLEAAQIAVFTLLALERFDQDESWYPPFARQIAAGGLPPWQSLLDAAQATAALRDGDPHRAATLARLAIGAIGDDRWSVLVALPRAIRLIALTELGRHAEVAAALAAPLPADLMRSPYGLLHLRARGRHHLATGEPQAAADDFRAIGDILTSWGIELPGLLPWRAELAEAVRQLGDREARLSRAEGKVARLASQGYTNREISGLLYITRSTVEQHLTRIYRKLGIDCRDELGSRML